LLVSAACVGQTARGRTQRARRASYEGDAALFLVGGAPTLELVDYKNLLSLSDSKGRSRGSNRGFGPVRRTEIDIVAIDRASKTVTFDRRAVVVGPDGPFPHRGSVNQLTLDKFPVYRLERVPAGADPFETIGPKVSRELGFDRLPGGSRP
jgi:hypothetical protein